MVAPRYTRTGVATRRLPAAMKRRLRDAWAQRARTAAQPEEHPSVLYTNTTAKPAHIHDLNAIDSAASEALVEYIREELAAWTGIDDLYLTSIYGFRDYKSGAILKMHLDRFATHAVSAIVNVQQEGDWPLVAYDHQRLRRDFYLRDDGVVLYESGTVIHGRPFPFRGELCKHLRSLLVRGLERARASRSGGGARSD